MTANDRDSPPLLRCFVLSQIGGDGSPERKTADAVLKHVIGKALDKEYRIERADEISNPGAITPTIIAGILEADLIVADLSDGNPNVFYELAMAHGYSKPTVHIQKANEKLAFDVKDMRVVSYNLADPDSLEDAQRNLAKYAAFAHQQPEKVETPLTSAEKFVAVSESIDPVAESNVRVMEAIASLHEDVKRVMRRSSTPPPSQLSSGATLEQSLEANGILRVFVERIIAAGRAEESDFASMITDTTPGAFDKWITKQLSSVLGTNDEDVLTDILWSDLLKNAAERAEHQA